GFANNNIIKALDGERVGTLFHREAIKWASTGDVDAREMAVSARECARRLQALSSQERSKILLDIADALEAKEEEILAENEADVAAAQQAGYEKSLISRLALKPGKISSLANSVRVLANMDEPVGRILKRTELADGIILEKTSSPLGVLLIIFESRPDALVQQIASLAVRSGNGLLLKGGKEAKKSNAILHKVITSSIPPSVGEKLIGLVTSREEIPELLKLDDVIDLVIPRGSNKLVSQIKAATKIPVLGHADGICHVFIDKSADLDMAKRIVLDAKTDYPAACNAMETLLVHKDLVQTGGLNDLILELQEKGVSLFGGPKASCVLNIPEANSFHHEYGALACTVEIVEDVNAAIDHIHRHGRQVITFLKTIQLLRLAHTDSIITEDKEIAELFLRQVDSAAVLHNASTRFSDGFRFGLGAEVGISTSRIHARGPVGVEGLLTTRWLARGSGQVVDGDKEIVYTHKDLNLEA
ncbi:Delta-1-pyrroline-5-carboxylate synthase, partial [Capsicum baccatum]